MIISFMTANYVARELGYHMTQGWMEGDDAVNAYFAPLATYEERFTALLAEIKSLGFTAIDLWMAHLNWRWATPEHIAIARTALNEAGLQVVSLAGWFGGTLAEVEASCHIAQAVGAAILGGSCGPLKDDRAGLTALLRQHGLRFGYENHPEEHSGAELLAKIGTGDEDVIGATVDTGWFGTHGCDAAQAIREVGPRIFHVHLKDVLAPGGHETCRYGQGCVPIQACVAALQAIGYTGGISVEHEPEHHNPNADCKAGRIMLASWLNPGALHVFFEDFSVGDVIALGSKQVTAAEIVRFAKEFDPQPFHVDADAAAKSIFGGLVASGWHTCAIAMRLMVDELLSKGASLGSPGLEQLRWTRPVRPGDTLTGRVTVLETKASQSKPDRGTVKIRTELFNQQGEQVMWMESFGMFGRKDSV